MFRQSHADACFQFLQCPRSKQPDTSRMVNEKVFYLFVYISFPKIRVEVGNVFFLREMDAHQFMTIFDPQKRIPALIDAVVSVILFQRIDVFCLAVELAEMHAVIQIDAPVGGKHHSSVG